MRRGRRARRREGIATRLVARVAYDAQMLGAATLSLEVDEKNEPARALYGALGLCLAEEGRRPGYYGAGHDALILRAPLPLATDAVIATGRPEPALHPPVAHRARAAPPRER